MIITEIEASYKWCPFARVLPGYLRDGIMHPVAPGIAAHNRVQEAESKDGNEATWHRAMNCVGSKCMAWQWVGGKDDGGGRGYCGLAGQRL